eukprot:COSAG06_NODE_45867_length_351_cov_0.976190_1_plen_24_part_01
MQASCDLVRALRLSARASSASLPA